MADQEPIAQPGNEGEQVPDTAHWDRPPDLPSQRLPVRAIRKVAAQLLNEGRTGGRINFEVFIRRYAELWHETMLGAQRAKRGKRCAKDRYDAVKSKEMGYKVWIPQYEPDEKLALEYFRECHALLNSLVKFRREMQEENLGIPSHMMGEIVDALKAYPEARDALLKRLEEK